mgnify:CR=1 FL=1
MFFNSEIGIELSFFGPWHLLQIFITALVVFLIYFYRKQLREFKHEKTLRYIIAGTLLVIELSLHVWHLANNDYYIAHMLPLNLCTINVYASIVIIFSKNKKVFNIAYFWGFGALLSVLFPDMSYGPDRYRYYQFFYAHMFFLWIYMYMIFVHDFRPGLKEFKRSAAVLFVLAIGIALPVNLIFGENYMFLLEHGGTPLEIIHGYGAVSYLIGVILVIIVIMVIWYSPIYWYLKRNNKI